MNAQFKKGVLELCVLTRLKRKDTYGYELAEEITQRIEIAEGTLYPLLRKLKEDGLCETYISDDSSGPPRKYYRLTSKGIEAERQLRNEWLAFVKQVGILMEDEQ
jgi:PadR family transcriptional regulator, regulatory protein PadR